MNHRFDRNYPVLRDPPFLRRRRGREYAIFGAGVGLVFALSAILFVTLKQRPSEVAISVVEKMPIGNAASSIGTVALLAPDREVRAGTPLSQAQFKEIFWPRNQIPEGAVMQSAQLSGQYAKIDLRPGQPVTRGQLTAQLAIQSLPLTVGNRAVSINVDETTGIEGHAVPGKRVDLSLTYYKNGVLTSEIIVQNARIIARGGEIDGVPRDRQVRQPTNKSTTLTLEVSPTSALKIQTARQLGKINLMMREDGDNLTPRETEQDANDIAGGAAPSKPVRRSVCGQLRVEGKEMVMDCNDGQWSELSSAAVP